MRTFTRARSCSGGYLTSLESPALCLLTPSIHFSVANIYKLLSPISSRLGAHEILPHDFWTDNRNQDKNFLDFDGILSEDGVSKFYVCAVKSLGPKEERSAVVRTWEGRCDVHCSTEHCEGLERLCVGEIAKIQHFMSGGNEGKTFVTHAAAECTPVSSQVASRVGSRAPTRPPTPAGS